MYVCVYFVCVCIMSYLDKIVFALAKAIQMLTLLLPIYSNKQVCMAEIPHNKISKKSSYYRLNCVLPQNSYVKSLIPIAMVFAGVTFEKDLDLNEIMRVGSP